MRKRRKIAAFLLVSLVAGGLMAPLSHFVYMSFSDAFGHSGHSMAGKMAPVGDSVHSSDSGFVCEYADLLATQTLGSHPESGTVVHSLNLDFVQVPVTDRVESFSLQYSTLVRGPPVA
ncbi:MAG: hypothetical protein HKN43_00370 [Rhodothermales bacterium]|nr:hypothetical protein [Rhodothermales bacterium]